MESQNHSQQQIQNYKNIIHNKDYSQSGQKIRYDWKKAELSLINHESLAKCKQKIETIRLINKLQQLYLSKYIPPFYSYYTIYSILQRNSGTCQSLKDEISKVNKNESNYQNINVFIQMRLKLMRQFISKTTFTNQEVEKLRSTTIMTVIKVDEWQKSFSDVINYPPFFLFENQPYIILMGENVEGLFTNKRNSSFLQQPNPLLITQSQPDQPIIKQTLIILKSQRFKLLQFSMNLPHYATIKSQHSLKISQKSPQKIKSGIKSDLNIKRQIQSVHINAKTNLRVMSQQQLSIIKKYRSLKNIRPQAKELKHSLPYQSVFDKKIKSKIDDLKQRLKNKTQSSRIQELSEQPKLKSLSKKIRIVQQREVDLKKEINIDKTYIIDSLSQLRQERKDIKNIYSVKVGTANDKLQKSKNIEKILKQTQFLMQSRHKQKQQFKMKNQTLKTLKQDLLKKVKDKNSPLKFEKMSAKSQNMKQKQLKQSRQLFTKEKYKNNNNEDKIEIQKRIIEEKRRRLMQQKQKFQQQFAKKQKLLIQRQKISKKIQAELDLKKLQVKTLHDKLQQVKQKQKQIEQSDANIQIQELKKQKQFQFELEKKKIEEVQTALSNKLKEEQRKYQSLQQQQIKREADVKKQYEEQVQRLKERHQRQEALIQEKLKQEEQKQLLYQKKVREQQEKLIYMQREITEWQNQQQQLLKQLKEQERKQREKEAAIRLQRQKRIDKQMQELQQQQLQFLSKYKQANQHLIEQLEQIKMKNYQLEQTLSLNK